MSICVQRQVQTSEVQLGLQLMLSACALTDLHRPCKSLHVQLQLKLLQCTYADRANAAACLLQYGNPVT